MHESVQKAVTHSALLQLKNGRKGDGLNFQSNVSALVYISISEILFLASKQLEKSCNHGEDGGTIPI